MDKLRKIEKLIAGLERIFIILLLGAMVTFSFLQVVLRTLLTRLDLHWASMLMTRVDWMDPFSRLLVLWLTFLGASLVTGEDRHIRIDIMSSILPPKWSPLRRLILSLACMVVLTIMVKSSIGYLLSEMQYSSEMFLSLPTWVGQLILPLGFSLLLFKFLLQGLEQLVMLLRGPEK
ncbi:MAG: TRAP transporter small permease [Deltaproteobacteria bacterium]|nr:TRAP transporter small permease [Deltaproteobacteria bacterium]